MTAPTRRMRRVPLQWRGDHATQALALIGEASNGCLEFQGFVHATSGYGAVGRNGLAHRVAYEAVNGPIAEGLHLDHLCRNRRCVNPDHLEPVSNRENILRGESFSAINAKKTHCPAGHPLSGDNVFSRSDFSCRGCLKCRRISAARTRAKRRGYDFSVPSQVVRSWARANGFHISDTGPISRAVVEAWNAEHPDAAFFRIPFEEAKRSAA